MRHLEEQLGLSLPDPDRGAKPLPEGVHHLPGLLSPTEQRALLAQVLAAVETAPWFIPTMPRSGRPFSVRMTNLGPLGWVSDRGGYRYRALHPETGLSWPPIPASLHRLWAEVAHYPHPPEACLVNLYRQGARMGLHQDRDEEDLAAPVVSVSLGDEAVFRVGGRHRGGPTVPLVLATGDVLVLGGAGRLCFQGVDRVRPGTSDLVPGGGRINLTLRRVTQPCG